MQTSILQDHYAFVSRGAHSFEDVEIVYTFSTKRANTQIEEVRSEATHLEVLAERTLSWISTLHVPLRNETRY